MDKKIHKKPIQLEICVSILAISKLWKNYELQGKVMAQWCAYLVMAHNIPQELVLNTDQIGIHIVPTCGDKTWETKGSQNVKVHGMEEKCQIICGNTFSC